mmetsp:Transcript_50860/g.157551  ORF Transcript_50860/g.157551 Transcript_50860/m.157551 type:complete len:180 (+) Transcript_50860:821-1360(+)
MRALKEAFERNMEKVYDMIVERGAFAWQMLYDGPLVMPSYFPNGTLKMPLDVRPGDCAKQLRAYCQVNGTGAQRALAYTHNANADNATVAGDQYAALFLLTRGDYAWIGYDYRGCKSERYPRAAEWDADYGVPLGACAETGADSMVFVRNWTKAAVQWDCNAGRGEITTTPPSAVALFV